MTTVTLRFQTTGAVPGDGRPVTMRGPSLTIGRGQGNDMVLPDPDRMVSTTHAVIENHNGNVVVVDLSTNGTFLNYGKIALGKTPTPLNSGDVLTMGPYELVVEIAKPVQRIADPLAEAPVGHGNAGRAPDPLDLLDQAGPGGDFLDDLLGGSAPTGPKQFKAEPDDPFDQLLAPLGDEQDPFFGPKDPLWDGPAQRDDKGSPSDHFRPSATRTNLIPEDWDAMLDLGPGSGKQPVQARQPPQPRPQPPRQPAPPPRAAGDAADPFGEEGDAPSQRPQPRAPAPPRSSPPLQLTPDQQRPAVAVAAAAPSADDAASARAFLRALGADEVVKDADLHATMVRLGGVLKAMITGIREVLMTRTHFKGEFRIDQTMIAASGNNPLKFSITPEQAVEALSRPGAKGYLPAQEATDQALNDIKAHEVAMVTGMEAALKGLLRRLDPKALEEKLQQKGGAGLFANKKARYWELYEEMYAEISDQAENQFHDLFAREFAAAYKAQLERLK